ncbi:MAG: DUF4296 domain-containing protein [Bacteroidota bacterium]
MRIFFLLLLFVVMAFSCKKSSVEKPEDLIPTAKMEDILYELAVLNGIRGISGGKYSRKDTLSEGYLYKKYAIDSTLFANSSRYYAAKPDIYLAIYKRVEARLNEAKQQAEAVKKMNDSLKNVKTPARDSVLLESKREDSLRNTRTP